MNEIMTTVFGLAGGLAMFLFGMNSMSDALQKAAGERMKQILSFLTKNPIMGALAGALVTAVLQSSSATTVMVKLVTTIIPGKDKLPQTAGLLYVSNNIDRMTEYSQRVTQTVQQVYQSGRKLSASAEQELNECYDTAHDLFDRAVDSVRYGDCDV